MLNVKNESTTGGITASISFCFLKRAVFKHQPLVDTAVAIEV